MFKKLKAYLTLLLTSMMTTSVVFADDPYSGEDYYKDVITLDADRGQALDNINVVLKDVLKFARGAGIIVCIIMLVWCAIQLGMSAGNNQKRQLAMEGIKNVLIATAIVGGATILVSIAHGLIQ